MATKQLSDFKFPDPVPYMQFRNGEIMRGGFTFGFRRDSNSWRNWTSKTVKTFHVADYIIPPAPAGQTGDYMQTDWFEVFRLPNNYRMMVRIQMDDAANYKHLLWELRDENDVSIGASTITAFSNYHGSQNQAGKLVINNHVIKIAVYTGYPNEPMTGYEPTSFGITLFWGAEGLLNLPENGTVEQCITFNQWDQLKPIFVQNIFSITDLQAADTYINEHGDTVPEGIHFIGEEDLPQDYDPSTPGGGDGSYEDNSDPIDFPGLPTGGALASGAIHAFHVNPNILTQMFQKLWSTSVFDMATWQKLVSSPLDCIISLHALPVMPVEGGDRDIWFGNFNTGLSTKIVASQYVTVDCGYLDIVKFFGSAMDFSPYTKMSIYLPFSGIHDLATEDVQGQRIHVKYNIDVLTGDCTINVKCGQSVLYKFAGNMKMQIPITARDDNALGNTIKGTVGMLAGALVGGAVGSGPGAIAGAGISAAASVAAHKVTVSRSGELTGNTGMLDEFVPYLIIHRPQQSLAINYNKFKGYPSNLTLTLGSCIGYTEVEHIHLEGINGATDSELEEIERLLKSGVLI